MLKENKKIIGIWYIVSYTAITIGVIIGSFYYIYKFNQSAEVKNYLDAYTNSLRSGMNFNDLLKSSFKTYSLLFLVIVVASLFKYGGFFTLFVLIRKGFISAFTTLAMIEVYGSGGILLVTSLLPEILFIIPVLALFSSISIFYSQNKQKCEKRDKILYIIFCGVIFTIFCGYVILEGFITTTFMKWIAFKVT